MTGSLLVYLVERVTLGAWFLDMSAQVVGYVHSWSELAILIKTSTNNPSQKSVVLESCVKPGLGCPFGSQSLV